MYVYVWINYYFFVSEDDVQKIVSVCVDGKEAQMVFIDHAHSDMAVRRNPHYALHFCVIYIDSV